MQAQATTQNQFISAPECGQVSDSSRSYQGFQTA